MLRNRGELKEKWRMWTLNICLLLFQEKNKDCSYNTFSEGILGPPGHLALSTEKPDSFLPEPFLWLH